MVGILQLTTAIAAIAGAANADSVISKSHPDCDLFASALSCQGAANTYGITVQEFLNMNPTLNQNSDCPQLYGMWYCVRKRAPGAPISTPTPTSPGLFPDCAKFATAAWRGSCNEMVPSFRIDPAHWTIWNPRWPWGSADCLDRMIPGWWYCVAAKEGWTLPPTTSTSTSTTTKRPTSTTKPKTTTKKPKKTTTKRL